MALQPGIKIDHYEILSPLGAGGMGEVWRARDARLNREVAIKMLPANYAHDADRLRRFKQEALATSATNHPNILTVHDIGSHEGSPYIVAELLEGEELRAQLDDGAIPQRKAVDYARQIVAGLAATHEKGLVHRDLKPENIFVTADGRVKILDFGLAKLRPQHNQPVDSQVATQKKITDPGTVMGTVGYMSPEQVRGQEADHRADIFAFGAILYEMLSGRRTFTGDSAADVMSAILKEEPPELSETNRKIPPGLEKIVRRCLEKRPERRFHSAHDLGFALEALSGSSGTSGSNLTASAQESSLAARRSALRERLGWIVAAALLLLALAFAVAYFRRAPAESLATYTYLPLPEKTTTSYLGGLAISPDGQRVVTVAAFEGVSRLWLYSFDAPKPELLAGTEGAQFPFWAPNGRSIGFFAQGKLKRIEAAGGQPAALCDVPQGFGGAWSSTGVILFAPYNTGYGLYQVSESGGTATPVTKLDAARLEAGHNFPRFLPDGRHFVFFTNAPQLEYRGIRLGSLDEPPTSFFLRADANAEYSAAGYLLFMRGRKILAQQFDPDKLTISGDPVPMPEQVHYEMNIRYSGLSVFSDRVLLYRSGGNLNAQLIWFDRSGRQLTTISQAGEYRHLNFSPDGRQVMLERNDPQVETSDLWRLDLLRETFTPLTSALSSELCPIWAPDGSRVAFTSMQEGFFGIYQKAASGADKEELLLKADSRVLLTSDWSSDGKFLVYRKTHERTGIDIAVLSLSSDRQPQNYLATQFNEDWGKISPDGHWMAYQSTESGRFEIYVQSFPEPGRKVIVSQGGGVLPRWRRDGKELYYVSADDKLMAVPVQTGANFSAGTPVPLFDVGSFSRRVNRYGYDVSADGQKFLVIRPLEDASTRPLTVVQNWTMLLKQ
jgi:Tol biopolymer transport system component